MIEKLPDWRDRLSACVAERMAMEPEWGRNDCMTWAADCVLAQTGVDTWEACRGRYRTPQGALKTIRKAYPGVKLPIDVMDILWGPRVHISQAMHGDLVVAAAGEPFNMGPSVGLCYGARSLFVGTGEIGDGLVRLDTLTLEHCYKPWALSSRA